MFDRTIVTRTFAAWCEDYYSTVATKHATAKLRILRDEAFAAWHVWAAQTRLFNAQCAETIARANVRGENLPAPLAIPLKDRSLVDLNV